MRPTNRGAPRFRLRLTAVTAIAALALAACGGEGDAEPVTPTTEGSGEVDDSAEPAAASEEAEGEDAPGAEPAEKLAAEDGWNGELHDLEFPGPGRGILAVEGQTIALDVTCDASGVLDDHGYLLFWFQATGQGEDADGRAVSVNVSRQLTDLEEASKTVYDYQGQERGSIQISVDIGDGMTHSSIIVSPGDDDSAGNHLPVVRVEESGTFSVVEEVPPFAANHDQALSGATELSGQCPDTWPEDASI